MSPLFWQSPADSCDSPRKLLEEFHSIFQWNGGWRTRILRSILGLPALFAQRNLDKISSAARETFFCKRDAYASLLRFSHLSRVSPAGAHFSAVERSHL